MKLADAVVVPNFVHGVHVLRSMHENARRYQLASGGNDFETKLRRGRLTMRTTFRLVWAVSVIVVATNCTNAQADSEPYVTATDVEWIAPSEDYSGAAFAKAFRYRTLVGGEHAPVQGHNVLFGEAEFAPGAVYVGHNHPSPEIYYVVSGEAEWTVDGETFRAPPGTTIYAKPYAVHRMTNVGNSVLKTVWMWWGEPEAISHYPKLVEPIEGQPARATFTD